VDGRIVQVMWATWKIRVTNTVDAALIKGSVLALLAYVLLHWPEIWLFTRCVLVGCGHPSSHGAEV
jgi:hypothetical protein